MTPGSSVKKVVIAAGASGGHVFPALATASVLRDRGHQVEFAGGDRLEARVVPEAGFPFHGLPVRRPPSVRIELLTPRGVGAVASIVWATVKARRLLRTLRPDVVLGMGGFAAVPVTVAAGRAGIAMVLHEQNAHLSLAQRIPLRWASAVALGLPLEEEFDHPRVELVGNPVRPAIASVGRLGGEERAAARVTARARLGLAADAMTLLVLGGSLGSGPLNDLLPQLTLPAGVQVLHVAGPSLEDDVRHRWESNASVTTARVLGFSDRMEDVYLAADLAVCRSGASVVAELALTGVPSVLVPLPTLARGDQEANARTLERAGAAVVVMQSDPAFEQRVGAEVTRLISDGAARASMAAAARSAGRPDAADRLADVVVSVGARTPGTPGSGGRARN